MVFWARIAIRMTCCLKTWPGRCMSAHLRVWKPRLVLICMAKLESSCRPRIGGILVGPALLCPMYEWRDVQLQMTPCVLIGATASSLLFKLAPQCETSPHLNLHLSEDLAVVYTYNAADHLGNNDHVTQVRLDALGLLHWLSLLLSLSKALDECHGLTLHSPRETATGTSMDQIHELLAGHVQQLVQVDSSEGVLPEGPFLLKFFLKKWKRSKKQCM